MDPSQIKLEDVNKLFEYERLSREVDLCHDVSQLQNLAKSYIKLYMRQQEVVRTLM